MASTSDGGVGSGRRLEHGLGPSGQVGLVVDAPIVGALLDLMDVLFDPRERSFPYTDGKRRAELKGGIRVEERPPVAVEFQVFTEEVEHQREPDPVALFRVRGARESLLRGDLALGDEGVCQVVRPPSLRHQLIQHPGLERAREKLGVGRPILLVLELVGVPVELSGRPAQSPHVGQRPALFGGEDPPDVRLRPVPLLAADVVVPLHDVDQPPSQALFAPGEVVLEGADEPVHEVALAGVAQRVVQGMAPLVGDRAIATCPGEIDVRGGGVVLVVGGMAPGSHPAQGEPEAPEAQLLRIDAHHLGHVPESVVQEVHEHLPLVVRHPLPEPRPEEPKGGQQVLALPVGALRAALRGLTARFRELLEGLRRTRHPRVLGLPAGFHAGVPLVP